MTSITPLWIKYKKDMARFFADRQNTLLRYQEARIGEMRNSSSIDSGYFYMRFEEMRYLREEG